MDHKEQAMFDFLAKILVRKTMPTKPVKDARLGVEELMPRVLPSANPFAAAWGHYADTHVHPAFSKSFDAPDFLPPPAAPRS
jgi:hypothetical protein